MKSSSMLLLIVYVTAIYTCEGAGCNKKLGMASGLIKDKQISAPSSYDVNTPRFARLNGNSSWCVSPQKNGSAIYLEVDLKRVLRLTMLSIQGYGGRYVTNYTIQYKRQKNNKYWRTMVERLPDNTTKIWSFPGIRDNTSKTRYTKLKGSRVVRYIRIVLLEGVGEQWCLRFELYGCEWKKKDGLITYRSAQGNIRGANETEVVMEDATYDGAAKFLGRRQGILQGGLGQLTDGDIGGNAFWYNLANGKGFEWVGWFDAENPKPSILFEFDSPRKFSKILFYANNRPGNVKIFRNLLVAFSMDGQYFSRKFVFYPSHSLRQSRNQSMWIEVDLNGHVGKYLNCEFTYDGKWIVLSEISFESVPYDIQTTEYQVPEISSTRTTTGVVKIDDTGTSPKPVARKPVNRETALSLPVIIAMAIVGFVLIVFTIALIIWLTKRHGRVDDPAHQPPNSARIVNPLKGRSLKKKHAEPCSSSSDSDDDIDNLVQKKMNNFVPRHQPWYKSLDKHKMNNLSGLKSWKTANRDENDDEEQLDKVNV